METLRTKWTQRARETLPKFLDLADAIENRLEAASETSPLTTTEYFSYLNQYNAYISTCVCFLRTHRLSYQKMTGEHTALFDHLWTTLPEHTITYTPFVKHLPQNYHLLEHLIRHHFEAIIEYCISAYMLMQCNMEDLIKVAEKTSSSSSMY